MAAVKKSHREEHVYAYKNAAEDELGDILWYFSTLCKRLGWDLEKIFSKAIASKSCKIVVVAGDPTDEQIPFISIANNSYHVGKVLFELGNAAAALLVIEGKSERQTQTLLIDFAYKYLKVIQVMRLPFPLIVAANANKVCGRFLKPKFESLPTFDAEFPEEEQLPWQFEIEIAQHENGQSYLQWNGELIGDPLTDNIYKPDGYRFHDVFHLAHAAILHWSPTFRGLIKHKRKSRPAIDENQDGGRAGVIEEGLTVWIFSCAKDHNFFKGCRGLPFGMLKTVEQFVRGYEVEQCPLQLWERAILTGYEVFRQVRDNNGGIIIGDRNTRSLRYRAN